MFRNSRKYGLILMISGLVAIGGCKEENNDDPQPQYEVPSTYSFKNVDYSGQTQRLSQFYELKAYMASARVQGTALDENRLVAMYENDSPNAQWQGTYDASKKLKDKTQLSQQPLFVQLLQNLATSSESITDAKPGQAGIIKTQDQKSSYLVNANGVEEAQLIEKGLMGACLYYQMAAVYMGPDKMNVDNTTVNPGSGTAMEHHWDEAFGYFGVPKDFPENKANILFWGSYSNSRDAVLNSNKQLMDAFLKGRAAISNNDLATRDQSIARVREGLERVSAASAIHYINQALTGFDDTAKRVHVLSEAVGFIYSLQFNPDKKHTNTDIVGLIETLAGSSDLTAINLYECNKTDLETVRDELASWYHLTDEKDTL